MPAGHDLNSYTRHHPVRQLLSGPSTRESLVDLNRGASNLMPGSLGVKWPLNLASSDEPHPALPSSQNIPQSETNAVTSPLPATVLPISASTQIASAHLPTSTSTLARTTTTSSTQPAPTSAASKIALPLSSNGATTTSSTATSSPTPQATPNSQQSFFSSLNSNPISIFFACLVGIAILGVTFAILSCSLRRWCNRRRRRQSNIDDDTWRFLQATNEFSNTKSSLDEDMHSANSSHYGSETHSNISALPPALGRSYAPSHPFTSHIQQQSVSGAPQYHFAGFPTQHVGGFIDEYGVGWATAPGVAGAGLGGLAMGPYEHTPEALPAGYPVEVCALPERVFEKPLQGGNRCNRATMCVVPNSAAPPVSSRRATMVSRASTSASNGYTRLPPLTRETSLACSEQSTTVETLRDRVVSQRTNLQDTLMSAIQRDKEADHDFLESLKVLWCERNTHSLNDNTQIILRSPEIISNDEVEATISSKPPANRTTTKAMPMKSTQSEISSYSVEATNV